MRMIKCLGAAIYPALIALTGCPSHPSDSKVPMAPSLQAGYIDGGGLLQWAPTGKPFQVYWYNGFTPCAQSDKLVSDGTNVVICHVYSGGADGGYYAYYVGKPAKDGTSAAPNSGVYMMHVGQCSNCPGTSLPGPTSPPNGAKSSSQALVTAATPDAQSADVKVSCPNGAGTPTTVDPSTGPSGLKAGDTVNFDYIGKPQKPPLVPFTITFQAGYCTGLKSPYQIGLFGSCQVPSSSAPATTYKATSADCTETQATLPAIP